MLQILLNQVTTYYGNTQPYLTVLYTAIFASAYYGLLRIGEVASGTHPVRAYDVHVGENKRKIRFYLRTSKTHWTDVKPQEISFSSTCKFEAQVNCPYRILREYMNQCPQRCINTQEPFFIFSDRTPITTEQTRAVLKQMLNLTGLDADLYNFHSLRIG